MLDIIHYYWHPESIPVKPREEDRGGFYFPLELVIEGWRERDKTGRTPHPKELSGRLVKRWVDDLNYFAELLERGKPKDDKVNGANQNPPR